MGRPMDRSKLFIDPPVKDFEVAFPTLEDAILQYTVSNFGDDTRKDRFSVREEGGLLHCRNPRCNGGGYEIDRQIIKMISEKVTEKSIELSCGGHEGTPKGRKIGRGCLYSIVGTLTLKHKRA